MIMQCVHVSRAEQKAYPEFNDTAIVLKSLRLTAKVGKRVATISLKCYDTVMPVGWESTQLSEKTKDTHFSVERNTYTFNGVLSDAMKKNVSDDPRILSSGRG